MIFSENRKSTFPDHALKAQRGRCAPLGSSSGGRELLPAFDTGPFCRVVFRRWLCLVPVDAPMPWNSTQVRIIDRKGDEIAPANVRSPPGLNGLLRISSKAAR